MRQANPMWSRLSIFILRNRSVILVCFVVATGFMAWRASHTKISYGFSTVVPDNHPIAQDYERFKSVFGEDGNVMVVGVKTPNVFHLDFFRAWHELGTHIERLKGINTVLSVSHALNIRKNEETRAFEVVPLLDELPKTQTQMDSLRQVFLSLPFYDGLIHNEKDQATLMAITFHKEQLDSRARILIVDSIQTFAHRFGEEHSVEMHLSGLPYIRTFTVTTLEREIRFFTALAVGILALLLWLLFRNIYAVIFPTMVVAMSAMWSLGFLNLFGFQVTILTSLLPTIIVVIGIPNCVYLLNKYHLEFRKHGNKQKSLMRTVEKTGAAIWFTNLTTAIGFGVFFFTRVEILKEFGIVAFVSIIGLFMIAVAMIPVVFSFLPDPKYRHIVHLDRRQLKWVIERFERWSSLRRKWVFAGAGVIIIVAAIGLFQLKSKGFILDDVPKHAKVYTDLKFFEKHFHGVLPFEIIVNSGRTRGAYDLKFVEKLDAVHDSLARFPVFSRPLSIAEAMKFGMQAYKGGNPERYRLPNSFEMGTDPFLRSYIARSELDFGTDRGFVDDSAQIARISVQVADIGSDSMPRLLARVRPMLDSIFIGRSGQPTYPVVITGTSVVATEGYNYLISGLVNSVVLAFLLISIIMGYLFKSFRMLFISLLPNVVPLMVTAGLMGYLGISLRPSTVLIFSVAFGISVDYTIHFLAKYRQELYRHNWDVPRTVVAALRETGMSMIYTSLILFFGFIVFTMSSFESTANLGRLTSITLVVAMFCNLVLLPALLIAFEKVASRKAFEVEPVTDAFVEDENGEMNSIILADESDASEV